MQHFEGIGSEFQWHKPSFLASHFLQGKWIGNLTNGHHIEDGDISSYFGLNNSDCNKMSLLFYKDVKQNEFHIQPSNLNSKISGLLHADNEFLIKILILKKKNKILNPIQRYIIAF